MDIRHVFKTLGTQAILQDISLQVELGALTALIGPNGAGKSTLLRVISGLLGKDSGEIYLAEQELKTWKRGALAQKLALLMQSNGTDLQLTVRELVSFGRFPYTKGKLTLEDEELVQQALVYVGLVSVAERKVPSLSGGQLQRAYIAMILAQDTDYILLDEPLNNLDMKYAVEVMSILRKLVDEKGKTVIIVLHDINFAANYSDEIIGMKDGQVYCQGPTAEIIEPALLSSLFALPIEVTEVNGTRLCLYFQSSEGRE